MKRKRIPIGDGSLTPRQHEVLKLISEQRLTNREIAEELQISEKTVERHVSDILAELGFSNRRQAAIVYMDSNIQLNTGRTVLYDSQRGNQMQSNSSEDEQDRLEELIAKGDKLASEGNWIEANELGYIPALYHMRNEEEKDLLMADNIARAFTDACEFGLSDVVVRHVENRIHLRTSGLDELRNPETTAAILERKGWNADHQGQFTDAKVFFSQLRQAARKLGDPKREATALHFMGIASIRNEMLSGFPGLFPQRRPAIDLRPAVGNISDGIALNQKVQRGPAVAMGWIRKAQGLILLGDKDGAEELINRSLAYLDYEKSTGLSYAHIELARLLIRGENPDIDSVKKAKHLLETALEEFLPTTQHSYVVAEAYAILAKCEYLLGDYKSAPRLRWDCADYCEMAMRIHHFPLHFVYKVAQQLQPRFFTRAGEYRLYKDYLEERVEARDRIFWRLDNFLHTSEGYQVHQGLISELLRCTVA